MRRTNGSGWLSTPVPSRTCRAGSCAARPTSIPASSSAPLSTDSEMSVATAHPAPAERTLVDRLLAAVPLLSIFLWLCIFYAVEAWAHGTPWLFGDELELTQLSRSIAETGHAARRGEPHSFNTLWAYVLAPAWRIDNTHTAYATVKYIGVIVMTLTAFPAYRMARMVVGRNAALFVAAASAAIPALAYSSMIVEEPLAYPYSTLCLFLILKLLVAPSRWWLGGTLVACAIAPLVRGELGVVPVVLVLAALLLVWRSDWITRWRAGWTTWDWVGLVVLLIGAGVILSAFLGHHSYEWRVVTDIYKNRMLDLGLNAAGALTIGLGVLPVVAGLASLWRAPGERPTREVSSFRSLLLAAIVAFGVYTAVKSAYVSTVFGTYTYERNLIYLAPLLFVGTALWLERRAARPIAVGLAGAFALYLILTTGYEMGQDISYNAPVLAILQQSNRWIALTPGGAKIVLVVVLAVSVAVLLAPRYLRRGALLLAGAAAAVVLAWNLTGEIAFATASNRTSDQALSNIRGNPTWLDKSTGGAPTLFIGQQMTPDQTGEWLLEFWNRSIRSVWSLDGTAQGPGPTLTPDMRAADGVLYAANGVKPYYPYVVTDRGIDVAGKIVAHHSHRAGGGFATWRLFRVDQPLRLSGAVTGLYADGWSGPKGSAYTRYSTHGGRSGKLAVTASWKEWGGTNTARVTVRMGELVIGSDKQPQMGRVTKILRCTLRAHEECNFLLPAPGPTFRVEVGVNPKFRPQKLSPQTSSDPRLIGAVVSYRFIEPRRTGR